MRLAIVGGRNVFPEKKELDYAIAHYKPDEIGTVGFTYTGFIVRDYCKKKRMEVTVSNALWVRDNTEAVFKAYDRLLEWADLLIVFFDGKSPTIKYCIEKANLNKVQLEVIQKELINRSVYTGDYDAI